MVDPHIGVGKKSIYLQHCNANHYQVVTQIRDDKSNTLQNYFTSQKALQDQHMLTHKTTSTQRKLSKREKQQLRKQNARTRMSVIRQSRSELDRENTKEQDRIRKLKDRKFRKEAGKEKQMDRLRKCEERRNKTELAKETDKQQNKVRKRSARINRTELAKEIDKQQNKVRMRSARINRTELAKEIDKQQNKAVANNLEVEPIPKQLSSLCQLESQLITRIIPFMKIVALPTGGQHGLRGQVVLVPSNIQKTATSLPRQTSESQIIALSLKRRLSDKYSIKKQYICPHNVNEALEYLKKNNPLYKNVNTNSQWTDNSQLENPELWKATTEAESTSMTCKPNSTNDKIQTNATSINIQPQQLSKPQDHDADIIVDSEEEVDDDNPDHVKMELSLKKTINSSTCLYPKEGPNVKTNQILHLAPGEGQRPTHVFYEKDWEAMTFPTLFPSGTNTFTEERQVRLTVKKYINARLLSSDTRFAESTEYTFQCLHWAEMVDVKNSITMQLKKTRMGDLNVAKLKNPDNVRLMLKNDELFASFKKIRGTPQYWKEMQQDMIAKIRQFGPYTFFLSGSAADFHWPELVQVIATQYGEHFTLEEIEQMTWQTKRNWIARNPVTAARHIDYIFGKVWRNIILSGIHPIGQILNYDIRKEMQSRGTEHFHAAVHVLNAPILDKNTDEDVILFIDKYISCAIPDKDTDPVLHDLVISRQTHHHTRTCKKRKGLECRFHFKKPPSSETLIARKDTSKEAISEAKQIMTKVMKTLEIRQPEITLSELLKEANVSETDYHSALTLSLKRTSVVLKRKPSETSINPYNPYILKALRANMDIQYITDVWACIAYITSYMCKPEREMSELMRNAVKEANTTTDKLKCIGNTFLRCREVSQHEAIARLVGLPLRQTNTTVQYVPTGYEAERTRMLKSVSELDEMDDDNESVYVPSILDKYAARPYQMDDLSLAEFASMYSTSYGQKSDFDDSVDNTFDHHDDAQSAQNTKPKLSTKLQLLQGLGWIYRRQKENVIRYYYVSKQKDSEKYYHRLLILYLPWREESQLKLNNSYEAKFVQVHDTIQDTIKKFEPCNDEVQDAYENAPDPDDIDEELWDSVAPPEAEQCRDRQISDDAEYDLLDPSNLDEDQVSVDPINVPTSMNSKRSLTLQAKILADVKYYKIVQSLNDQQRMIHDFIFSWCTSYRISRILGNSLPDPFYVFLTGGAGVGKSHAVHAIFQSAIRQLRREGASPDTPTVILTASTGKAAVNIGGTTLHSAFHIPCKKHGESSEYHKPSAQILNSLRAKYAALKIIIIDEISMVGAQTLSTLNLILQDIFENNSPFGGVSILAVGDLLQLNPVGDRPVFQISNKKDLSILAGSLWQRLFKVHELHEIVRQQSDPEFANMLSRLRLGQHTKTDIEQLKSLETNSHLPANCVSLFLTNREVEEYNEKQLKSLCLTVLTIQAEDTTKDLHTSRAKVIVTSKSPHETAGLRDEIKIAVGARYMHTKNTDLSDGLVNGATGEITHIEIGQRNPMKGIIYVKFDSNATGKEAKKQSKYPDSVPITAVTDTFSYSEKAHAIKVERTQYPGTLAWGMTIHKAQGSTYDYMIGNMKSTCSPKPGQMYTMFSRVKSRSGLQLIGFDETKIKVNKSALSEMERLQQTMQLKYKWPIETEFPNHHYLAIGLINIRSLKSHHLDLKTHPFTQHLDIICLTETHVTDPCPYRLPKMTVFSVPSQHGCAIYSFKPVKQNFTFAGLIETVAIITDKTLIVCLYIPPNRPWMVVKENLVQLLNECTTIMKQNNCDTIIVTGDFNIDLNNPNEKLTELIHDNNLHQLITESTHNLAGILDLVITNHNNTSHFSYPVYFTDHHFVITYLHN
ncbi:uncharacterized protein [Ptychodera flava]|uniref:uncharacterized protein n=1 Tax=Ptychodera flava TaxID=63121 RepID=UPI003969F9E9